MNIKEAIQAAANRKHLTAEQSEGVCTQLLRGEATPAQIASLLTALRMKGETTDELLGFVKAMRAESKKINSSQRVIMDTCGTGGDLHGTFNVSTAAAFVIAAAGIPVAKHGNRAVSSSCGSADVLSGLGVKIDCAPEVSERCLREIGICFLFAPLYHPAMSHAAVPRREMGLRTIFNMAGPLTNPAGATHQVLGAYSREVMPMMAEVLQELRCEHALIVHSEDGLDEISLSGVTHVIEVEPEAIQEYDLTPEELGLDRFPLEAIRGGDTARNAEIIREILSGQEDGAPAQITAALAGAALYIGGKATSLVGAVESAREVLASGQAAEKLEQLREMTQT